MKQILLSVLLMLLPMQASADAVEIDGIYYNLIKKGKIAEVTHNNWDKNWNINCVEDGRYQDDIIIPETIEYEGETYTVISIGESAFQGCICLTSVSIPNTVTSIGKYAFTSCSIIVFRDL